MQLDPVSAVRRLTLRHHAPPMSQAQQTLAQRLLDGDKRALARAITLVESDDPAGWELVREVYPHTGQAVDRRADRRARARASRR